MGLGDMAKKAKDALSSDKGEQVSDKVLDGTAGLADKVTGGKHADKIQQSRDAADERIGTPTPKPGPRSTTTHGTGGTDGVNAVGNAGGSGHGSGTTTAGADSAGPEQPTGRHRA